MTSGWEVKNLRLKEITRLLTARKNFWLLQKDFTECLPLSNLLVMLQCKTLNI